MINFAKSECLRPAYLISTAAAVVLAVGIATPASAAGAAKTVLPWKAAPTIVVPGAASTLVSGDSNVSYTAGNFTGVDAGETINCRRTCSISAAQTVELLGTAAGDHYAICFVVDGSYANGCPYSGVISADGAGVYQSFTNVAFFTGLAPGMHTVQTQFYDTDNTTIGYYSLRYDVLK